MIQTRMSIAPIMMPILVSFFCMIILLRVEGAKIESNEASMTKQKTSPANRRDISDGMTDKWQTKYKRESLDVDSKVDDIMFSLQDIDVYSDIVKLNTQLRNKLKWIVEASKGPKEESSVIRMLKNDVQGLCKPLDLNKPHDCTELKAEHKNSGVYTIYPDNSTAMTVYCNMDEFDGGWTVLQRRQDSKNFYRTWAEYKKGFGNVEKSFWLGNDNIHILTSNGKYELRIDLGDWTGNKWYAIYKTFAVGNETNKYILTVGGYSGNAKDSLTYHNGMKFTTKDRDNDKWSKNCAEHAKGGWWYLDCHHTNLNGIYKKGKSHYWNVVSWNGIKNSMKFARMMIRRL